MRGSRVLPLRGDGRQILHKGTSWFTRNGKAMIICQSLISTTIWGCNGAYADAYPPTFPENAWSVDSSSFHQGVCKPFQRAHMCTVCYIARTYPLSFACDKGGDKGGIDAAFGMPTKASQHRPSMLSRASRSWKIKERRFNHFDASYHNFRGGIANSVVCLRISKVDPSEWRRGVRFRAFLLING